jgi:hypothetical protein
MQEAHKIKNEQYLVTKLNQQQAAKDELIIKENKIIVKKDKEARKLEILEAEVLKRLRDTHIR